MAPRTKDTVSTPLSQEEFESLLQEQLRQAVRLALVTILEAEVDAFIGALYQLRIEETCITIRACYAL